MCGGAFATLYDLVLFDFRNVAGQRKKIKNAIETQMLTTRRLADVSYRSVLSVSKTNAIFVSSRCSLCADKKATKRHTFRVRAHFRYLTNI